MQITPLRHSLPNASDAAVSHKHLSDLPGWSHTDTVEKIQPQGQNCWQQPRILKGSSPPLQRGPVLRGCRAGAIHSTRAVPSAHISHRQLATCSEGCLCRGRLRLGSSFARFPLAGFTLCSSADPRQISSWPCCTERRSRPRGIWDPAAPQLRLSSGSASGCGAPGQQPCSSPRVLLGCLAASLLAWEKLVHPAATGSVPGPGLLRSEGETATKRHPRTRPTSASGSRPSV